MELDGVLKFNVDGVTRGKLGPSGIGGVLLNCRGEVIYIFSRNVGIKDSNEAEVLPILEALNVYSFLFKGRLCNDPNLGPIGNKKGMRL